MKTSEQMKGLIRNISKKTGVNPNSLLQMCLFEGILEKLSKSKYRDNFILKGGLLISSLIGVNMRSTKDMDATVKGLPVNEETITTVINEILDIDVSQGIDYKLLKLEPIRKSADYVDFCASIRCVFGKINATLNMDITTGDVITPSEILYSYTKILEKEEIEIMTYTLETILAEKFEALTSRNITTTRARDFYDLYMLYRLYQGKLDPNVLRIAIENTSRQRGTLDKMFDYDEISELFKQSKMMQDLWTKYVKSNPYAAEVNFLDTVSVYEQIGSILKEKKYEP